VSKANSQYETIGAGDNQMVTTKLETISLETVAPLHLGVFALKVFWIVPYRQTGDGDGGGESHEA
jgi:hypothetical protein